MFGFRGGRDPNLCHMVNEGWLISSSEVPSVISYSFHFTDEEIMMFLELLCVRPWLRLLVCLMPSFSRPAFWDTSEIFPNKLQLRMLSMLWTIQLQLVFSWTKGCSSIISNNRCEPYHPRSPTIQIISTWHSLQLVTETICCTLQADTIGSCLCPNQRNTTYSCSTRMLAELNMVLLFCSLR